MSDHGSDNVTRRRAAERQAAGSSAAARSGGPGRRWRRVALALLALAVAGGAALAFTMRGRLLASNVAPVLPGRVYRSAQLPAAALDELIAERGLRAVVNLRGRRPAAAWYRAQAQLLQARDVELHDLRLSARRLPSRQQLRRLIEILDAAARPTLVHCSAGTDRTGLASALALLLDGADLDRAGRHFGLRYGFMGPASESDLPGVLEQYRGWLAGRGRRHTPELLREFARGGYTPYFYDASIEPVSVPDPIRAGEPIALAFRVRNRSPLPWRFTPIATLGVHLAVRVACLEPGCDFDVSYRGDTPDRTLAPGEAIVLEAGIPALREPGRYRLSVDLVDEMVAFFADMGSTPLDLEVEVAAPRGAAAPAAAPLARPGDFVSDGVVLDRGAISLEGRVAIVTGGGGGIGRAIAETLAAHGAAVVVAEIDPGRAEETAKAIGARGGRALAPVVDVREAEQVAALTRASLDAFGRIDVLVNNVGHFLRSQPFVETGAADWDAQYRINLEHVFLCTRAVTPQLIEQGEGGSIINVSTIEAFRGIPGCVVYSAMNAAITGFTRSLAVELGPAGIRVNAIAPETTETLQVRPSRWIPEELQELVPLWTPLGRFGRPDDAAGCALFLASELSSWVTGTTLHLDGGALAAGGFYRTPDGRWTNTPVVRGSGIPG